MTVLLPRLDRVSVDERLATPDDLVPPVESDLRSESPPTGVHFAASGGSRATTEQLLTLRSAVITVAEAEGFPNRGATQARSRFDAAAGAVLAESELLKSGEALRDDAWAYLATVLLPDVCAWRFPELPAERFHGGVRNTLQRLWMRAVALDRGEGHAERWGLLTELSEDALVQITERPSIGGDHRIAGAFAEAWVRAARKHGRKVMEDLTRAAVIRVRLRNQIQLLSSMDDDILEVFMDIAFYESEHVIEKIVDDEVAEEPVENKQEASSRFGWLGFQRRRS